MRKLQSSIFPSEDIADVREVIDEWATGVGGNSSFEGKLKRFPQVPAKLVDRDEDRWMPLFAIADACDVGDEIRAIAVSPQFAVAHADVRADLIVDTKVVFDGLKMHPDRIWSENLVKGLHQIHESPWGGEWCGLDGKKQPHKISQGEYGHIIAKEWEIRSGSVRIGSTTKKGYYLKQFDQAFSDVGVQPSTALVKHKSRPKKTKPHPNTRKSRSKKRHSGTRTKK